MSEENRQIKYGAMISYLAIILNSVISLAYTPWMANQLGKSQYGLYNLAYSFVRMFLVDLGLNAAVSRFVAKYDCRRNRHIPEDLSDHGCSHGILISVSVSEWHPDRICRIHSAEALRSWSEGIIGCADHRCPAESYGRGCGDGCLCRIHDRIHHHQVFHHPQRTPSSDHQPEE